MRIWIDIENPPQVQYLLPFRRACQAAGCDVVVTARDVGTTVETLVGAGTTASVFGSRAGRGTARKVAATASRTMDLVQFFARRGRPDSVVSASRSAALAAWQLRIPSFVILDYEHVNLTAYRLAGSLILHPDVIHEDAFLRRGVSRAQLWPFSGIKEDLTFAGVDVEAIRAHDLGAAPDHAPRVVFRPPAETSHYYRKGSTVLARAALEHLAGTNAVIVFSPREPNQVRLLERLRFTHEPVVLNRPAPFASLLKSVDAVVCSGGTMLREAAYLGVPAYSIFHSDIGAVDRWLARIGRAKLIGEQAEVVQIDPQGRGPLQRLDSNPHLLDSLTALITAQTGEPSPRPLAARNLVNRAVRTMARTTPGEVRGAPAAHADVLRRPPGTR